MLAWILDEIGRELLIVRREMRSGPVKCELGLVRDATRRLTCAGVIVENLKNGRPDWMVDVEVLYSTKGHRGNLLDMTE